MDPCSINVLSVCSGVGSLDLGVRIACPNARTVCYLEREAFACEILATRMQQGFLDESPIWSDIGTFDGRAWRGVVDLVIAGLPCQPYSVAGKRKGDADERYLWPSFFKILRDVQPAMVFLENVAGLLKWFRPIGDELSGLGYRFEAGLFSAAEVGANQRRERFFCLASNGRLHAGRRERRREKVGRYGEAVADTIGKRGERRGDTGDMAGSCGEVEGEARQRQRSGDAADDSLADMEHAEHGRPHEQESRAEPRLAGGGRLGNPVRDGLADGQGISGPTSSANREMWISIGPFAPGPSDPRWRNIIAAAPWLAPAIEPGVRGVVDGMAVVVDQSRVDQLRGVGNGVVPLTAAKAFRVLAQRLTGGFLEERMR